MEKQTERVTKLIYRLVLTELQLKEEEGTEILQ